MFISILIIIYFYRYIVLIYIAIYYSDYNSYKRVTSIYIVVTVFEYRYNCIALNSGWDNCKDMVNGSKWD